MWWIRLYYIKCFQQYSQRIRRFIRCWDYCFFFFWLQIFFWVQVSSWFSRHIPYIFACIYVYRGIYIIIHIYRNAYTILLYRPILCMWDFIFYANIWCDHANRLLWNGTFSYNIMVRLCVPSLLPFTATAFASVMAAAEGKYWLNTAVLYCPRMNPANVQPKNDSIVHALHSKCTCV